MRNSLQQNLSSNMTPRINHVCKPKKLNYRRPDASFKKAFGITDVSVKIVRCKVFSVFYGWTYLNEIAMDIYKKYYLNNKYIDYNDLYSCHIVSPNTSLTREMFKRRLSDMIRNLVIEDQKMAKETRLLFIENQPLLLSESIDQRTCESLQNCHLRVQISKDSRVEKLAERKWKNKQAIQLKNPVAKKKKTAVTHKNTPKNSPAKKKQNKKESSHLKKRKRNSTSKKVHYDLFKKHCIKDLSVRLVRANIHFHEGES
ncbi:hypothetical protein CDAR_522531 [Caerostris darwini]|uniref:Uncharacterized protein n=1 Tax=Caerostris darwini TaxID=1538125 RepID=A0AAV4VRD3_9ARAC|nr:hypothetical protein CDAR_522531 [Caerostris darwini]